MEVSVLDFLKRSSEEKAARIRASIQQGPSSKPTPRALSPLPWEPISQLTVGLRPGIDPLRSRASPRVGPRPCNNCGLLFDNAKSIRQHRRHVHPTSEELVILERELPFVCIVCGLRFKTMQGCRTHMSYAHPTVFVSDFKCDICGKYLETPRALNYHKSVIHKLIEIKYSCKLCDKQYGSLKGFEFHQDHAHQNTKYHWICGSCGDGFLSQPDLQQHTRLLHDFAAEDTFVADAHELDTDDAEMTEDDEAHHGTTSNDQVLCRRPKDQQSSVLRFTLNEEIMRRNVPRMTNFKAGYSKSRYHSKNRSWSSEVTTRKVVDYRMVSVSTLRTSLPCYMRRTTGPAEELIEETVVTGNSNLLSEEDRLSLEGSMQFINKFYPEVRNEDIYEYTDLRPLPYDGYQGRLKVHVWGNNNLMLDINAGFVRVRCGGMMYIFELPKNLVLAVTSRLIHKTNILAIRHGDVLGLFEDGFPENWRQADLVADHDYTSLPLTYDEAMQFLMTDVDMGTRNNDIANLAIKRCFLW